MMPPRSRRLITGLILCLSASGPLAHAAAPSTPAGGYGPIRLGMPEAEAKRALAGMARDATFLSMAKMDDYDPATMAKMVVAVPWEDTYVGTIDPTTRLQFGVHAGHVVSVNLRGSTGNQGKECRALFAEWVKRNEVEFGPIPVADTPSNPAAFTDGSAKFPGWTLWLSRTELEPGRCDLGADYIAAEDKAIETEWRASRR